MSLRILKLNHNKIKILPNNFIETFVDLEYLDLSSNHIESINFTIDYNPVLKVILLTANKLRKLPNGF